MSKSKRGFAAMSQEKRRAIASLGGKARHVMGRAHTWTREEARAAGIRLAYMVKRGCHKKDIIGKTSYKHCT